MSWVELARGLGLQEIVNALAAGAPYLRRPGSRLVPSDAAGACPPADPPSRNPQCLPWPRGRNWRNRSRAKVAHAVHHHTLGSDEPDDLATMWWAWGAAVLTTLFLVLLIKSSYGRAFQDDPRQRDPFVRERLLVALSECRPPVRA